jgi:DNA-binding IscR family transcriptional regulator
VLHVLLHMAEQGGPVTSETLAKAMQTNPVVIRRVMAGLRERGYVHSEKGHGGGWTLACDLSKLTLRDVYEAVGEPSLLAIGNRTETPSCLVEQAVNAALGRAFDEAEALLLSRFGAVTLAQLSADFHKRLVAQKQSCDLETIHAA